MENATPESLIFTPESIVERIDGPKLFGRSAPMEIELGAGDGSFLVEYAAQNPGTSILGLERLLGRLRKIDRKSRRRALTNVRLLRLEASYFLGFMVPPQTLKAIHLYFPDPWPKRKHHKNRLVNDLFVQLCGRALETGGSVFMRTDDAPYFAQMKEVFGRSSEFEEFETPSNLCAILTDFERGFLKRNIPTLRAAYRKK